MENHNCKKKYKITFINFLVENIGKNMIEIRFQDFQKK